MDIFRHTFGNNDDSFIRIPGAFREEPPADLNGRTEDQNSNTNEPTQSPVERPIFSTLTIYIKQNLLCHLKIKMNFYSKEKIQITSSILTLEEIYIMEWNRNLTQVWG